MKKLIKNAIILYITNTLFGVYCFHWPIFPSQVPLDEDTDSKRGISTECPWCTYETKWFEQNVDHFNFINNRTFEQRYLINTANWKRGSVIFFYCGNEAEIEYFAKTMGLMWEMAPDFKAMVVFAEQRYQGKSLPFGKKSLSSPQYTGYLSSPQVLADFSKVIQFIKTNTTGAESSPVIAFGGSLGGNYAAWMRMKYPNIIAGSIASSAPLFQFSTHCGTQYSLVTKAFEVDGGSACVEVIRKSWSAINRLASKNAGREFLSKTFSLCEPMRNYFDVYKLRDKLALSYLFLAMENYPHTTTSKPAWPIKKVCRDIKNSGNGDKNLIKELTKGLSVYFNHSKALKCLYLPKDGKEFLGAWNYQSCTEMAYPLCSDGKHDMFYRSNWDIKGVSEVCKRTWQVKPDLTRIKLQYGNRDIAEHSNIVFSNGDMDPWSGGGVLSNISDSIIAIHIKHGAHNYDLLHSHKEDLPSVLKARKIQKYYVRKWIEKWQQKLEKMKLRNDIVEYEKKIK